jgi:signal transduction histidine kinase
VASASPDARPTGLRLRDSLAVRVAALLGLVLAVTTGSAALVTGRLRSLQESLELLTQVYVVFDQRLAAAHLQAMRIGLQVAAEAHRRGQPPAAPAVLEGADLRTFEVALEERERLVAEASGIVDAALRESNLPAGSQGRADLEELRTQLAELETLVAHRPEPSADEVLRDDRTQALVERRFQLLAERSQQAVDRLRERMAQGQERAERMTLVLAATILVLGLAAAVGVALTLRPLRRLTLGVRRLGRGDLHQRVEVAQGHREDEVTALGREFNAMAEALEERERRLLQGERLAAAGQLAAQVAHEIRNPLASMALNAELLADELEGAVPEAQRLLQRIGNEVDRLTQVTDDYLAFARHPAPVLAPLDLAAELGDLLDFLGEELDVARILVRRDFGEAPAWVAADRNQLRRAFLNLLRNAQEALRDEALTRTPEIVVTIQGAPALSGAPGEVVTVAVADNGPGVQGSPDRIFEAFYTEKARGTGLGLPIVQQIIQDHGGAVRLARTGPEGTCFEVRLPACDPGPETLLSERAQPAESGRGSPRRAVP